MSARLAGAVALFGFLVGCVFAFHGPVDRFALYFGIGLSLVGGAILDPFSVERIFVRSRYGLLRLFCLTYLAAPAGGPPATIEEAAQRAREDANDFGVESLRFTVRKLRQEPFRVRAQVAAELPLWQRYSATLEEFLERLDHALM